MAFTPGDRVQPRLMVYLRGRLKLGDFGKVLMRFASAQIVSNFLRMLAGFLVVRAIEPALYGQFTGIGVYMGYILIGHGGIINGLGRELPYALGRGRDDEAREMASSVFCLSLLIGIVASLIFLVFGVKHFILGNYLTGWIFMAYVVMAGLHIFNKQFLPTLYRTNSDFDSLSKQNIFTGIGNILTVLMVWAFGIYGLIARGVLMAVYECFLLFKNKPYTLDLSYHLHHFRSLFKTGLPIFGIGYVNSIWITILSNILFTVGGALSFGLFAISNIVASAVGVLPTAFAQVIYPRMVMMLSKGKNVAQILRASYKPLIFQFVIIFVKAEGGALLLPVVVPILLPKYTEGVLAAQWMIFIPVAESFGALNNIYNVVKKQRWYFISLITGAVVGSLYIIVQLDVSGFRLEYFPQGMLLGKGVQQIMALLFISRLKESRLYS